MSDIRRVSFNWFCCLLNCIDSWNKALNITSCRFLNSQNWNKILNSTSVDFLIFSRELKQDFEQYFCRLLNSLQKVEQGFEHYFCGSLLTLHMFGMHLLTLVILCHCKVVEEFVFRSNCYVFIVEQFITHFILFIICCCFYFMVVLYIYIW